MRKAYLGALAASFALACTGQAAATVMVATYHGGTNGFQDSAGLFGGVSDNGSQSIAWTAVFTFDPDVNRQTSGLTDVTQGGLGAVFTMNGHSISIGGSGSASRNNGLWKFSNSQADGLYNLQIDFSFIFSGPPAALLDQEIAVFDNSSCGFGTTIAAGTGGSLCASSLTVERGAANPVVVPEPATWGLLILGFGGVGAVLRQRRRRVLLFRIATAA